MSNRDDMRNGATSPQGGSGAEKFKFTEAGEEVFGQVTAVRLNIDGPHGPFDIVEIADEERGEIAVFGTNYQLKRGLIDGDNPVGRRVAVGDTVLIAYQGKEDIGQGKTVANFQINVLDGGGTPPADRAPAPAPAAEEDTPF